jgi:hypothetical protein
MGSQDMIARGQKWLAEKVTAHASRTILYRRGESQIAILAAIGTTYVSQFAGDGLSVKVEVRDYLVDVDLLRIDDELIEPRRTDKIIEVIDGFAHHFEVLPIGEEREWRYSDPYRNKFRIHTKSTRFVESIRPEFAVRESAGKYYLAAGQLIDFGTVPVGQLASKSFQLFNAGTDTLTIDNIVLPTGITISGTYDNSLDIGDSTTITFAVNTGSMIDFTNREVRIETNDANNDPFVLKFKAKTTVPAIGTAEVGVSLVVS